MKRDTCACQLRSVVTHTGMLTLYHWRDVWKTMTAQHGGDCVNREMDADAHVNDLPP